MVTGVLWYFCGVFQEGLWMDYNIIKMNFIFTFLK